MYSSSSSLSGTPRRRYSRSSSISSSQSSIKHDTRVNVFVRARPFDDSTTTSKIPLDYPSEKEIRLTDQKQETTYKFDHVFSPSATNQEVCNVICSPLIDTVLDGYNGSFLVYGQTGTGKSFTVQSEDGLIPTTINELFTRIDNDKSHIYNVHMSYLQIYHERIYDLLDPSKESDMHLREHPTEGIIIEGLTEFAISSTTDAEHLIALGRKQLIVAETKMVRMSSRSHSICLLRVEKRISQKDSTLLLDETQLLTQIHSEFIKPEDACWKGKLYLCDLAGSERLKKSGLSGDRLKEARYINSSLLELGNVIHALSASRNQHVPFRNSTLTRLLKESLGGNSRASLMICISSSPHHISETKCSLNFGQRALRVTKSSSPNVELAENDGAGNEDVASHIAHSYTIMRPRTSNRLLPKIDYKALSEYLTKKLKELETAYNTEKQSYIKMQEEMVASRKGVSRIPVPLSRTHSNWKEERSRRLHQEVKEVEREELREIKEEKANFPLSDKTRNTEETDFHINEDATRLSVIQQRTQSTWTDTTDGSSIWPKSVADKEINMDEAVLQQTKQETSQGMKQNDFATMASQTDENANVIPFPNEMKEFGKDNLSLTDCISSLTATSQCFVNESLNQPVNRSEQSLKAFEFLTTSSQTEELLFYNDHKKGVAVANIGTEYQHPFADYNADPYHRLKGEIVGDSEKFKESYNEEPSNPNKRRALVSEYASSDVSKEDPSAIGDLSNMSSHEDQLLDSLIRRKDKTSIKRYDIVKDDKTNYHAEDNAMKLTDELQTLKLDYEEDRKVKETPKGQDLKHIEGQAISVDQESLDDDTFGDLRQLAQTSQSFEATKGFVWDQGKREKPYTKIEKCDEYRSKDNRGYEKHEVGEPRSHKKLKKEQGGPVEEGAVTYSKSRKETLDKFDIENDATKSVKDTKLALDNVIDAWGTDEKRHRDALSTKENQTKPIDSPVVNIKDENDNFENYVHHYENQDKHKVTEKGNEIFEQMPENAVAEEDLRENIPDTGGSSYYEKATPGFLSSFAENIEDNTTENSLHVSRESSSKARNVSKEIRDEETTAKEYSIWVTKSERVLELGVHSPYSIAENENSCQEGTAEGLSATENLTERDTFESHKDRSVIYKGEERPLKSSTLAADDQRPVDAQEEIAFIEEELRSFAKQDQGASTTHDEGTLATQDKSTLAADDESTLVAQDDATLVAQEVSAFVAGDQRVSVAEVESSLSAQEENVFVAQEKCILAAQEKRTIVRKDESTFPAREEIAFVAQDQRASAKQDQGASAVQDKNTLVGQDETTFAVHHQSSSVAQEGNALVAQRESVLIALDQQDFVKQNEISQTRTRNLTFHIQNEISNTEMPARNNEMPSPSRDHEHQITATMLDSIIPLAPTNDNILIREDEMVAKKAPSSQGEMMITVKEGRNLIDGDETKRSVQDNYILSDYSGNSVRPQDEQDSVIKYDQLAGSEQRSHKINSKGSDTAQNECILNDRDKTLVPTEKITRDFPSYDTLILSAPQNVQENKNSVCEDRDKDDVSKFSQRGLGSTESSCFKHFIEKTEQLSSQNYLTESSASHERVLESTENNFEHFEGASSKKTESSIVKQHAECDAKPKELFDDSGFVSFEPVEDENIITTAQVLPKSDKFSEPRDCDSKAVTNHNEIHNSNEQMTTVDSFVTKEKQIISQVDIQANDSRYPLASTVCASFEDQSVLLNVEEIARLDSENIVERDKQPVHEDQNEFIEEQTSKSLNKTLDSEQKTVTDIVNSSSVDPSDFKEVSAMVLESSTDKNASFVKEEPNIAFEDSKIFAPQEESGNASPLSRALPTAIEDTAATASEENKNSRFLNEFSNPSCDEQIVDRHLATANLQIMEGIDSFLGRSEDREKHVKMQEDSHVMKSVIRREPIHAGVEEKREGQKQSSSKKYEQTEQLVRQTQRHSLYEQQLSVADQNSSSELGRTTKKLVAGIITPETAHDRNSAHESRLNKEIESFIGRTLEKPSPDISKSKDCHIVRAAKKGVSADEKLHQPLVPIPNTSKQEGDEHFDYNRKANAYNTDQNHKFNDLPAVARSMHNKSDVNSGNQDSVKLLGDSETPFEYGEIDLIGFEEACVPGKVERKFDLISGESEDEFLIQQGIITDDKHPSIKKAIIVDNSEEERRRFRLVSIGEARKITSLNDEESIAISPSEISDFLPTKQNKASTVSETKPKSLEGAKGSDRVGIIPTVPLLEISPLEDDSFKEQFSYAKPGSVSPSPSSTSTDSEICHALKEKDKLKKALNSVKSQYEGLLQEFDRIITSNSGTNDESVKISKESYQIALQCKEELETELTKAKEQLALVIAANEEQKEGLLWQGSDSEFSEETDSVIPEENEDGEMTPRATSTPLPTKEKEERSSKSEGEARNVDAYLINIDENIPIMEDKKRKSSVPKEETVDASTASISHDLLNLAYKVSGHNEENISAVDNPLLDKQSDKVNQNPALHKFNSSELQRLPATLPRRRGSSRRPRTMILEEGIPTDLKWINKRGATSEEQARKNQKLTLQAIENAELKKELLLTKLEKIRLEAMLSCVMMRLSPNEVDSSFRKISVNSITSSSSTLRSTTSLTNIPQADPTSPFQPMSPIKRSNPRVGSPLSGRVTSPLHPRVRFGEPYKAPSSTISPRSSSVFGHLSQLTQSSLSPSSLDFDISSCASSEFRDSPVPLERFSPYGQDDDSLNSPYTKSKGKPDGQPDQEELAIAYKGKNKMLLTACLPFLRKKKGSRRHIKSDDKNRKDSYGSEC